MAVAPNIFFRALAPQTPSWRAAAPKVLRRLAVDGRGGSRLAKSGDGSGAGVSGPCRSQPLKLQPSDAANVDSHASRLSAESAGASRVSEETADSWGSHSEGDDGHVYE